ncbi:hypothetical protein KC323_g165 [Hortaea werneckii]|nr:hypothetical protein KC323_g165 [Hortaea werneckii]
MLVYEDGRRWADAPGHDVLAMTSALLGLLTATFPQNQPRMPDMPGVHEDCRPGTRRCRQTPARQPVRDTDGSRVAIRLQLPIYKADNHHGCQGPKSAGRSMSSRPSSNGASSVVYRLLSTPPSTSSRSTPVKELTVKLDEAIRRTMAVPVCWNLLVPLAIGHVAAFSVAVDAEEGLQCVMCYALCGSQTDGERTIVKVRVRLDRVVPPLTGPARHNVEGEGSIWLLHGIIQLLKAGHVHRPGITCDIQVVPLNPLRCAEDTLDIVQSIPDCCIIAANGEGWVQGDRIAGPDHAHDCQNKREVDGHPVHMMDGSSDIDEGGHGPR